MLSLVYQAVAYAYLSCSVPNFVANVLSIASNTLQNCLTFFLSLITTLMHILDLFDWTVNKTTNLHLHLHPELIPENRLHSFSHSMLFMLCQLLTVQPNNTPVI